ncbi:hypothetical protein ACX80E_02445 [Arthrobacter sp. TMN-49]
MVDANPWSANFDPREVLAEADNASNAMVNSTEPPRGFMITLVALIATITALVNVVSWSVILGLAAFVVPLGIWYYLMMRKRPKPRVVLSHSGPYLGYALLLMLVVQFSRFWATGSWGEVAAKWLVTFWICGFCMSRMRTSMMKNRIKDANERPI